MVVFMDVSFQPCLDQIAATADAICARAVRASFQSQRFDGGQVPIALRTGMQNRLALRVRQQSCDTIRLSSLLTLS
jgi:hypothetical protein